MNKDVSYLKPSAHYHVSRRTASSERQSNFFTVCTRTYGILISFPISCTRKRRCNQSSRHKFLDKHVWRYILLISNTICIL